MIITLVSQRGRSHNLGGCWENEFEIRLSWFSNLFGAKIYISGYLKYIAYFHLWVYNHRYHLRYFLLSLLSETVVINLSVGRSCTRPVTPATSAIVMIFSNPDKHNPSSWVNSSITNTTQSNNLKKIGGMGGLAPEDQGMDRGAFAQKRLRTTAYILREALAMA